MAEASDMLGIIRQNLLDAGCDMELTTRCLELAKNNHWNEILSLLSKQKDGLLNSVHNGQKKIDCLDFLVYKINKEYI